MARDQGLTRFLGWFSIGLGLAEVVATRAIARLIGVRQDANSLTVLRIAGARELSAGIGILAMKKPTGWLWARVAGDAMDLALLSRGLTSGKTRKERVAAATAAVLSVTVLDVWTSQALSGKQKGSAASVKESSSMHVKKTLTINRSPEELYNYWHDFQNLPRFMRHLESVQTTGDGRSHWKAKAPAGKSVEWDAEITEDRPNELIAWRSLPGADVANSGSVRFVPATGGRGTQVQVEMQYDPPAGKLGSAVAKIFGEEPEQQVQDDLRAFRQVMETGEVVLSDGTLVTTHIIQRPAQPSADGNQG